MEEQYFTAELLRRIFTRVEPSLKGHLDINILTLKNDQDGTFMQSIMVRPTAFKSNNDPILEDFSNLGHELNWDLLLNTLNATSWIITRYHPSYQMHWVLNHKADAYDQETWFCQSKDGQVAGIFNIQETDMTLYLTFTFNSL